MTLWNEHQSAIASQRRDALAELVAEGPTVAEAGRILGISANVARKLWGRIKADLGERG